MPETANFSYEGNAVFNLSSNAEAAQSAQVEIVSVQHLIPIKVTLINEGVTTVIGAYVDYTDKSVTIPESELNDSGLDADTVAKSIQQFLANRVERQMAESEAEQTLVARQNFRMAQVAQAAAFAAANGTSESDEEE